jgi:chitodextrinase
MAFNAGRLHDAIVAVCPIIGVTVADPADKATWAAQFDPAATAQQRTAAQNAINSFDAAAADQADRDAADLTRQLGKVMFNHENRIRALEGKAAVTAAQFMTAVRAL